MTRPGTILVLGATGGIGSEGALAFSRRGWQVRALHRHPQAARADRTESNVEWVRGDAMNAADVVAAAKGARFILHGVNPPQYRNWASLAPTMLESSIAAAKASGARLLFPGSIYNFPPDGPLVLREDTPHRAVTRKGAVRIALEQRLAEAASEGVCSLVLRAGDFFGPQTGGSWFSQALVKPGRPLHKITYPGPFEIGHSWAYLPDLAETFALLAEREAELGRFEVFHFRGHWFERGVEMAEAIRRVAGMPNLRIAHLPWWLVGAASPFVPLMRELWEMRYLWRVPMQLDNERLVSFLGQEPHTGVEEAVRTSLIGLGCLPAQ
jgi:nucleoside-diphosphate-sugar epimerase